MVNDSVEIDIDDRYAMIPILARQYLDARGALYGRDPNTGIDCLGLVAMAATQAGFDCPNMLVRTPDANGRRPPMMDAIRRDMREVEFNDLRRGDMLVFKVPVSVFQWDDHLAVVSEIDPLTMIHTDPFFSMAVKEHRASDSARSYLRYCILNSYSRTWEEYLTGAFRFRFVRVEEMQDAKKLILRAQRFGRRTLTEIIPKYATTTVFPIP